MQGGSGGMLNVSVGMTKKRERGLESREVRKIGGEGRLERRD